MDSSEKASFAGVLAMLAETFNTDIGPRGVDGYWVALQTLSFADFSAAVHACLRECRFMPKPAEILERAPAGNVDMLAAQAWESVTKVSHRGGDKLPDPVANRVVAMMGGWHKITSMPSEQFHVWCRKEFLRMYGLVAQNESVDGLLSGDPEVAQALDFMAGGDE